MSKIPKKLSDVPEKDLVKFSLVEAFFLQLTHSLMGIFPAIIIENDEPIICLDKSLLAKVGNLLTPRQCHITEIVLKVDPDKKYGFDKSLMDNKNLKPLLVFTEDDFTRLTKKEKKPFKWAPGLIGGDMSAEEFIDTLKNAVS